MEAFLKQYPESGGEKPTRSKNAMDALSEGRKSGEKWKRFAKRLAAEQWPERSRSGDPCLSRAFQGKRMLDSREGPQLF